MNAPLHSRRGFTLTETMFSVFLFTLVSAGIYVVFIHASFGVKEGTSQANFIAEGRMAEQKILKYIQQGRAIAANAQYIDIFTTNNSLARIYYEDLDNNPYTVEDNSLKYNPDTLNTASRPETICRYVTALEGGEIFKPLVVYSPSAVQIAFHVGDSWSYQDQDPYKTGQGYQGLEIRFSATPRNINFWYQEN